MLRLKNLSNKYQKRLIRPVYAQTQATPYATALDESTLTGPNAATGRTSFKNGDGSRYLPKSGDTSPLGTRTADAYTLKSSLASGVVMVRTTGELVGVASGVNVAERPFGLLANFVGGDLDDIGDEDSIGVWRGANHAFFELLAPGYDDTGLASALSGDTTHVGVLLYAGADGRLVYNGSPGNRVAVARCIDRIGTSRILIELLV
jgi:hypothetical protein